MPRLAETRALLALCAAASAAPAQSAQLGTGPEAWRDADLGAVRGLTVGPIESAFHPDRGYGSEMCALAMQDARQFGANWVSITPFGRVYDLAPSGVSLTYEAPFRSNRARVVAAIRQAHASGLKVMLVPHLWVENGEWRGLIDPGDDAAWETWSRGYQRFVDEWAAVARETNVEMLVVGIELRTWVTSHRAPSFAGVIREVRRVYPGLLTYAANWDDVHDTVVWGELDVIGVNAFFPLAKGPADPLSTLEQSSARIAGELEELARLWQRPILFTEFGYTTRADPALEPWLWPEQLEGVVPDQMAQANAYRALLGAFISKPWFAGGFAWRVFADPYDLSQEPEWGFSPQGKLAELVLKDAFRAHWAADGSRLVGQAIAETSAMQVHLVGIEP
ncbi:MAG TPA: hypothetical protein VFU02_22615 [Polyangiaceae bacterium]|nr:hypothetical protein [Polyangiaceae bacterium]